MFCPHCGNQTASAPDATANFCTSCGAAFAPNAATYGQPRIVRPLHPRMIAGVCSGLAIHFGWDIALTRIVLAVIACLTSGCAILFYLAAWVLIPEALYATPAASRYARATV